MHRNTIAALATFGLMACGGNNPPTEHPPPCVGNDCPDGGSGTSSSVTILYTGNVGGFLEPCG